MMYIFHKLMEKCTKVSLQNSQSDDKVFISQ